MRTLQRLQFWGSGRQIKVERLIPRRFDIFKFGFEFALGVQCILDGLSRDLKTRGRGALGLGLTA